MKNTNNKSIIWGLKILSILAFSVMLIPAIASADYGANYNFGTFNGYNTNYNGNSIPPAYNTPAYVSSPTVYTNTTTNVVHTTTTKENTGSTSTSSTTPSTTTSATSATPYSSLSANALVGSNGFLPSGLVQWVILAIIILVIIILIRKIFGGEKKYLSTPLKHS